MDRHGIVFVASYPKSGNTYVRLLLEAYRNNGFVDINNLTMVHGDSGATLIQGVSPTPIENLGLRGEALVRPAALLGLYCRLTPPVYVKTHWANIQLEGLPPAIPPDITEKAIYVVRDPRDVFSSFSRFYGFSNEKAADEMNSKEFTIGGQENYARSLVSSWSVHVGSWVGEQRYPVHVVRYEDMLSDPEKELTEILEFLGKDVDEARVKRAVKAASLKKARKQESENGFKEYSGKDQKFFTEGGSRWKDELGPKWIKRIESDHGKVMEQLGYL